MTIVRHKHAAAAMRDGKVLVVGGSDGRGIRGRYASAEVFDPSTSTFSYVADMHVRRFKLRGTAVVLGSGEVLVAGGADHIEVYDPETKTFRIAGDSLGTALMFATATSLSNGDVFIAGGYDERIRPMANAWVYHP
ncbi:MAG: kelch repeat-containing protein [Candidatus Neomarinimicrobiota bacterium]